MLEQIQFRSINRKLRQSYAIALVALFPLVMIIWSIPIQSFYEPLHEVLNPIILVIFIMILTYLAFNIYRVSPDSIWTSIFWLPLQSVVFFGVGPLVEVFGNEYTRLILSNHILAITPTELYRSNVLSITGIFLVILGIFFHMVLRRSVWGRLGFVKASPFDPQRVALIFIFFGGYVKYFLIKPNQWSDQPGLIPGFFGQIGGFVDIGFAILAYLIAKGDKSSKKLFAIFWPIHFFLTSLSFSKMELLMAMLLPIIGFLSVSRGKYTSSFWLFALIATYLLYQPISSYGRHVIFQETGTITQAGYFERIYIISRSFFPSEDVSTESFAASSREAQRGWTRLNYAGVQSAAMSLHDAGHGNPQLHNAWMFFVPRIIWPDKPNLSFAAVEFYRLVTGNDNVTSFLGISHYGDLYWQYGWLGVFLGAPMIGFFFASMAVRSLVSIRQRDFLLLPAVLLALNLAILGPTGAVLNTMIGGGVIYFAYIILINILKYVLISMGSSKISRMP